MSDYLSVWHPLIAIIIIDCIHTPEDLIELFHYSDVYFGLYPCKVSTKYQCYLDLFLLNVFPRLSIHSQLDSCPYFELISPKWSSSISPRGLKNFYEKLRNVNFHKSFSSQNPIFMQDNDNLMPRGEIDEDHFGLISSKSGHESNWECMESLEKTFKKLKPNEISLL